MNGGQGIAEAVTLTDLLWCDIEQHIGVGVDSPCPPERQDVIMPSLTFTKYYLKCTEQPGLLGDGYESHYWLEIEIDLIVVDLSITKQLQGRREKIQNARK